MTLDSKRISLSFKASEYGHRDVVSFLIESGADGRMHPVTKYSPLYIAAYNGKKEVGSKGKNEARLEILFY